MHIEGSLSQAKVYDNTGVFGDLYRTTGLFGVIRGEASELLTVACKCLCYVVAGSFQHSCFCHLYTGI